VNNVRKGPSLSIAFENALAAAEIREIKWQTPSQLLAAEREWFSLQRFSIYTAVLLRPVFTPND